MSFPPTSTPLAVLAIGDTHDLTATALSCA